MRLFSPESAKLTPRSRSPAEPLLPALWIGKGGFLRIPFLSCRLVLFMYILRPPTPTTAPAAPLSGRRLQRKFLHVGWLRGKLSGVVEACQGSRLAGRATFCCVGLTRQKASLRPRRSQGPPGEKATHAGQAPPLWPCVGRSVSLSRRICFEKAALLRLPRTPKELPDAKMRESDWRE